MLHFPKGGWLLMLAVSQIHGKYLPQEQTPLGCGMAVETQTLAGLCVYKQTGRRSLRMK